ncbi:SWI/SNF chromatin-remodeling complex subunit, partial [Coemansia sp. RSA 2705]
TTAAPSSSSSQELLADLTKSIAGSTIAHMSPVASSTEAPTNGAAVTATPQTAAISAAVMASLQSMSPAQRQLLIMQHHQQQQQQLATTAASMAAMVPQLSPQQQQQQQHQQQLQQQHQNQQQQLLQIQMALVQAVPNFVQLPPPVQQTLMTAFAQQRQLHHQQQQLQAALATQPLTQQTRGVYMAQAATVQAQLQSVSQALAQNVAYARSLMAVTSAAPAASAAAVAASTGGPDGSGSALFLQSSGNASEPTVTQAALTADASAAANGAGAGGGLKQPADKQTLAANFREEPSPQPTVMATDQIGKVLNSEQQATLGKWQREAARIARANAFRLRETAGYEQREAAYRAVLEEQRVRNADAAQRLRREREAEAQAPWNAGYSGLGNGTTGGAGYGTRVAGPGGVALVLPAQRAGAGGRAAAPRPTRRQLQLQAAQREELVPVRLDIDADGFRLRDTFTWDLNNVLVSPQQFAAGLCADLELPADVFAAAIAQAIEEQVDDYARYAQAGDDSGALLRQMLEDEAEAAGSGEMAWVDDELRVVVRIDVIIGHIAFRDQLEWDVAPLLRPLASRELERSIGKADELIEQDKIGKIDKSNASN